MSSIVLLIAAAALVVAAALAVWRAQAEAAARADAEARAQAEAAARADAEARAQREAKDRARAQERAQREIEARRAAEERAKAEAAARRDAERRAARLGSDIAEDRANVVMTIDEKTIVTALSRAVPTLNQERAKRLENQIESLARLRSSESALLSELEAASNEEERDQIRRKIQKVRGDAEALVQRLRNILSEDPALSGIRLSLAWGTRISRISTNKANSEKKEEKKK